jgi:hypothetical protein
MSLIAFVIVLMLLSNNVLMCMRSAIYDKNATVRRDNGKRGNGEWGNGVIRKGKG